MAMRSLNCSDMRIAVSKLRREEMKQWLHILILSAA